MTRTDYQLIDISEDGFVCLHILACVLVMLFFVSFSEMVLHFAGELVD